MSNINGLADEPATLIQPAAAFAGPKLPKVGQKRKDPARGDERGLLRVIAEAMTVQNAAREEERPQSVDPSYRSERPRAQTLDGNGCHAFSANWRGLAVIGRKKGPIRRWGLNGRAEPKSKVWQGTREEDTPFAGGPNSREEERSFGPVVAVMNPREEDTGHVTSTGTNMMPLSDFSNATRYMPAMRDAQGLVSVADLRSRRRERPLAGCRDRMGQKNTAPLEGRAEPKFADGNASARRNTASAGGRRALSRCLRGI